MSPFFSAGFPLTREQSVDLSQCVTNLNHDVSER